MTVMVHQWRCSLQQQEEQQGFSNFGGNRTHDGLSFAWDGVEDPFQPETHVFGKIVREGFRTEHRDSDGGCRCGGWLRNESRAATPAEEASYYAAKRVRVPASMFGGTMTGQFVPPAASSGVSSGSDSWAAELVKALREQLASALDEIKGLRSMMLTKTESIVQAGKLEFANLLKNQSQISPGTFVINNSDKTLHLAMVVDGATQLVKIGPAETQVTEEDRRMGKEIAEENHPKKSLAARIKDSEAIKSVTAETKDASWRGAALMTIDLAKQCLEKARPFLPKQYQKFHKPLMEFVATPLGGSALAYGAGMLLSAPFMPGAGTGKQKRIAYELRVNATTVAGYTLIKPLVGFMTNVALGGFAGILAGLPDVEEATGVRVAAGEQSEGAHEDDESDSAIINAHNKAVAAAKVK